MLVSVPAAAYQSAPFRRMLRERAQRLDVVDDRRPAVEAGDGGERRAGARHAPPALDRGDQGGLLAADEGAGAFLDLDVEIKAAPQDVLAQQAGLPHFADRPPQPLDGQGILGPDIDITPGGADRVGRDQHAFKDRVRVALDQGPVHESARVALVGVADEIPLAAVGLPAGLPFAPRREAGAAPAPETGALDRIQHLLPGHGEAVLESPVPVPGEVMVEIIGVDDPAVAENDPHLRLEHGHVEEPREAVIARVAEMPGEMVRRDFALFEEGVEERRHVLGADVRIADPRPARHLDIDERLQVARADAAHRNDPGVDALPLEITANGVAALAGAGRQAAGGRADVDDGPRALLELLPAGCRRPAALFKISELGVHPGSSGPSARTSGCGPCHRRRRPAPGRSTPGRRPDQGRIPHRPSCLRCRRPGAAGR